MTTIIKKQPENKKFLKIKGLIAQVRNVVERLHNQDKE